MEYELAFHTHAANRAAAGRPEVRFRREWHTQRQVERYQDKLERDLARLDRLHSAWQ